MNARYLLIAAVMAVAGVSQAFAAGPTRLPVDRPTTRPAGKPAAAKAASTAPADKPASKARPDLTPLAEAIEKAADPLAAVDAYARGYAIDPNSLILHKAYLKRMLRADLPEMAYDSARVVATAEAENALAWSVLAHKHLQRGRLSQALAAVVRAEKAFRKHPFALKVAAVALGRYDAAPDRAELPESLRQSIKRIRPGLGKEKAFAAAQARARAAAGRSAAAAEKARKRTLPVRTYGKKPAAKTTAPEAKPTVEELLARSQPLLLQGRLARLTTKLGRQASSLRSSIGGAGGSPYGASSGRSGYYRYESYGRPGSTIHSELGHPGCRSDAPTVRGSFGCDDRFHATLRIGSPWYSRYPVYGYPYRVYGSVTHGRRFRGMFGSTTYGRPFRGIGGVVFRRWGS